MISAQDDRTDDFGARSAAIEAEREARRIFQRTLASWASDLLSLRHRGLRSTVWSPEQERDRFWSNAA